MTISKSIRLLMASTALAGTAALLPTSASAVLITVNSTDSASLASNAKAVVPLAIESLSASAATANTQTLGTATYNFKFLNKFSGKFNVTISLTGANISTLATTNIFFLQGSGGTSVVGGTSTSNYGCVPQVLTNTVILTGCDATSLATTTTAAVGGIHLASVAFTGAGGLNVAGQSISFTAQVTDQTGAVVFETMATQNVVTSYQALTTSNTAVGSITVDATSSPTFTTVSQSAGAINLATNIVANAASTGALTAVLGQIGYGMAVSTPTGVAQAQKTDFSAMTTADIIGNHVVTLTSPVLALPAVTQVVVAPFSGAAGATSLTASAGAVTLNKPITNPSTVTIASPANAVEQVRVTATFDGATVIPTTGSGTMVDVPTAGAVTVRTYAGISGTLAGLTQGGYTNGVNNVLNSKNTGFQSFIRLHNNSASTPNTVTLNVYNNTTGALLGSYVSPSVPANGSLQISAADIEAGASITATAGVNYDVGIRGTTFSGYAQHILFNTALGLAVDLSANRGTAPK